MPNYSVSQLAVAAVVILGVLAIVYIASHAMGVIIPSWVVSIFWVLLVVFIAVLAIRFVTGVGGDPKP